MSRSNDVQVMQRPGACPARWWVNFGNTAEGPVVIDSLVSLNVVAATAREAAEAVAKALFTPYRAVPGGARTYVVGASGFGEPEPWEVMHRERDGAMATRKALLFVTRAP